MRHARKLGMVCSVVLASTILVASGADARPGGGGSFSGGSRGGGSTGGGSTGGGSRGGGSWGNSSPRSGGGSPSRGSDSKPTEPTYSDATRDGSWKLRPDLEAARVVRATLDSPPVYPAVVRPTAWPAAARDDGNRDLSAFMFGLGAAFFGVVGAIVSLATNRRRQQAGSGWSTQAAVRQLPPRARRDLESIRATDPDFSIVLLEDFLYTLYSEVHTARGANQLDKLAPYLGPMARRALTYPAGRVQSIVVGSMSFREFDNTDPSRYRAVVEFESNYAEVAADGREFAVWVVERWWLSRARTAKSRPPERARTIDCPNCGAPLDKVVGGTCRYCNQVVDQGNLDWTLDGVHVVSREARGPMLTGTTEERGTDWPTVVDTDLQTGLAALSAKDPAFNAAELRARVELVFNTMQRAWSSLEWHLVRPYLSDNLYQAQTYWIEAYRRANLRNFTDGARVVGMEPARVTSDRWFDAITLRVYAVSLDYTIRVDTQAVVGGNRYVERKYTEYWTMIRGASAKGRARAEASCPRCGAPITAINMAGNCTSCNAKVNSGEFDWVLARIEQDESYTG
ncbi:MAG: TIM44-like domain-containing protein [Polyangiaceae bacterium]